MKTLKRNLEEEFNLYFDVYIDHWSEWIESGSHPFTPQQVKVLRGYQLTGSLKAMSKKWKVPAARLRHDLALALDLLVGSVWRYYKWCQPRYPQMLPLIISHRNDIRFAKAHITKTGLKPALAARLEAAGILTPLHLLVEDKVKIQRLAGPQGYKDIISMLEYFGCLKMWR